jgi:3-deoxy-D-manno-octulosonic acid kinase
LPQAYTLLAAAPVRAAIRTDLVPVLAAWLLAPRLVLPAGAEPLTTGRGGAYRIALADGRRAVVRLYRRGGVVARVVRETYVGARPRPLRELVVTEEARRRGVPTPEVLAARVQGRFVYRGALVTAEIPAAVPLLEALRMAPDDAARRALAAAAGRAVARLHGAGVVHADLNLDNIVVRPGDDGIVLLDFDRAGLRHGALPARVRRSSLRRLARSCAKLDPDGATLGPGVRGAFRRAYAGERDEQPCGC